MKNLLVVLVVALLPSAALAQTFIGAQDEREVIFTIGSEGDPNAEFSLREGRFTILGIDSSGDMQLGYSNKEYIKLNVRMQLVRSADGKLMAFLVLPLLGDLRIRPGANDLDPPFEENLSVSNSYGGIGAQLIQDITRHVRFAYRGDISHVSVSEMLPPGSYTEGGAQQMNRVEDGYLNLNTIDASGFKVRAEIQAEILRKLIIGLQLQHASLIQNGVQYFDRDGQLFLKYRIAEAGPFDFDLYGDYYVRLTDLTDKGEQRTFQLLRGGFTVGW